MKSVYRYFFIGLMAVLLLTGCVSRKLPEEQLIVVGEMVEESQQNNVSIEAPVVTEEPG